MADNSAATTRCESWTADQHIAEAERLLDQTVEVAVIASSHDGPVSEGHDFADLAHEVIPEYLMAAQAHATLAVAKQAQQAGICDHGNAGVCMSCVIVHDLLRPRP